MNRGLEPGFVSVNREEFIQLVDTFDYGCSAWSDFIEFWERRPRRLFGLEGHNKTYWVHPDLRRKNEMLF